MMSVIIAVSMLTASLEYLSRISVYSVTACLMDLVVVTRIKIECEPYNLIFKKVKFYKGTVFVA